MVCSPEPTSLSCLTAVLAWGYNGRIRLSVCGVLRRRPSAEDHTLDVWGALELYRKQPVQPCCNPKSGLLTVNLITVKLDVGKASYAFLIRPSRLYVNGNKNN